MLKAFLALLIGSVIFVAFIVFKDLEFAFTAITALLLLFIASGIVYLAIIIKKQTDINYNSWQKLLDKIEKDNR